jgi:Uma2 family endonuclease
VASHPRLHRYTYDTYLENESSSNVKHEFLDGEIYAMAGGTVEHAVLAVNVSAALRAQLRDRPCLVASSDLKVRVLATGLSTYPDVTVICGPVERDAKSREVVLNPTLVVEVTSDSTEEWDRGEKLEHYKLIPSLQECVLVSHRQRRIEVIVRASGSWKTHSAGPGESVGLPSVDATLAVDDVYSKVDLTS